MDQYHGIEFVLFDHHCQASTLGLRLRVSPVLGLLCQIVWLISFVPIIFMRYLCITCEMATMCCLRETILLRILQDLSWSYEIYLSFNLLAINMLSAPLVSDINLPTTKLKPNWNNEITSRKARNPRNPFSTKTKTRSTSKQGSGVRLLCNRPRLLKWTKSNHSQCTRKHVKLGEPNGALRTGTDSHEKWKLIGSN